MFLSDWRVLLRRWYVVVLALPVTVLLCALAIQIVPTKHEATSAVLLLPPMNTNEDEPNNPFLALGGLDTVVGVVATSLGDRATEEEIREAGGTGSYTVEPDLASGGPVLLITAEDVTPNGALGTRDLVSQRLPLTLAEMQATAGVSDALQIRSKEITRDETTQPVRTALIRALVVAIAAGVVGTVLAAAALDGFLLRRADRGRVFESARARTSDKSRAADGMGASDRSRRHATTRSRKAATTNDRTAAVSGQLSSSPAPEPPGASPYASTRRSRAPQPHSPIRVDMANDPTLGIGSARPDPESVGRRLADGD
jgi:hypothetical protein